MDKIFDGLSVLEAGRSPACRFCGWMFAAHGARVLNGARSGIDPVDDLDRFLDHRKSAQSDDNADGLYDVVLVDSLTDDARAESSAVVGVYDAFGATGPKASWVGSEAVLTSIGGATGYTESRAGVPVYGYGNRYQYLAGLYLYSAIVAVLRERDARDNKGEPTVVRVSGLETVVSVLPYLTTQFEYNGSGSIVGHSGPRCICPCIDGWVVIMAGMNWSNLVELLGSPQLADDPRFVTLDARFRHSRELTALFDEWCKDKTLAQIARHATESNVGAAGLRRLDDLFADQDVWDSGGLFRVQSDESYVLPAIPYRLDGMSLAEGGLQ